MTTRQLTTITVSVQDLRDVVALAVARHPDVLVSENSDTPAAAWSWPRSGPLRRRAQLAH